MPSNLARPKGPDNALPEPKKIPCKFCNKLFVPKRSWQLFCHSSHRTAYWNIQYILDSVPRKDNQGH